MALRRPITAVYQRARAAIARQPALTLCLALAYAAALVPIWWPRFLPLLDQPNHLASIAIWHRLGDPSWNYQHFYTVSRLPVPYWGYYLPVHLLAYVFPIEVANKLYLSLYAAALPASVIAFGHRFGRSPWLALLTFPLIFSYSFSFGFISFCAGLPTALFALTLLDAFLDRPTPARFLGMLACTIATYFLHVMPWMLLGVCAFPILVAHAARWRRVLPAAAALLATCAYAWHNFKSATPEVPLLAPGKPTLEGRYERPLDSASILYHRILAAWPGSADEVILILLALAWILLAATSRRRPTDEPRPPTFRDFLPETCFALCIAAYLLLPFHIKQPLDWWNVNARLVAAAALFGALLVRGPIAGRRRLLLAPAFVAAIAYPLLLARQYRQFSSRASGIARVMKQVPRGSSTLTLMLGGNGDPAIEPEVVPYIEFHSYAQLLGGGYNPYQLNVGFPFRPIPHTERPAPFWNRPGDFSPSMAGYYDFILTHAEPFDGSLFGRLSGAIPLIARDGEWRLYKSQVPR